MLTILCMYVGITKMKFSHLDTHIHSHIRNPDLLCCHITIPIVSNERIHGMYTGRNSLCPAPVHRQVLRSVRSLGLNLDALML